MVLDIFTGKTSCVKRKLLEVPPGSNVYKQKPKKLKRLFKPLNITWDHFCYIMSNFLHLRVMLTWKKKKK